MAAKIESSGLKCTDVTPIMELLRPVVRQEIFSFFADLVRNREHFARVRLPIADENIRSIDLWDVRSPSNRLSAVVVKTKDNVRQLHCFKTQDGEKKLAPFFDDYQATTEKAFFAKRDKRSVKYWTEGTVPVIYGAKQGTKEVYHTIHNCFGEIVRNFEHSSPITLISAGCGDARDLKTVVDMNADRQFVVSGFDLNSDNLALACGALPEGEFFQGEIQNLETHLKTIKAKNHELPTILLFSGILQDATLDGTYEAVRCLQDALPFADLVLIGNLQAHLIERRFAKAVGFKVETKRIEVEGHRDGHCIHALTPQKREERIAYLEKRNERRSRGAQITSFDLSMSANPLQDLIYLTEGKVNERIKVLDLSWAKLKPEDMPQFFECIKRGLPALESIMISTVEPWRDEFLTNELSHVYKILQRCDQRHPKEVAELPPQIARFFNVYSSMPFKVFRAAHRS